MLSSLRRRLLTRRPLPPPRTVFEGSLLAGRRALITGAGRNVGRGIARSLARQGVELSFTERDPSRRAQLAEELKAEGFAHDVTLAEERAALIELLARRPAGIDVLVNNVGVTLERDFWHLDPSDWDHAFRANVTGPLDLTRHVARRMISERRRGSILFVTSVHDALPARWPSYSAAKSALRMVIEELAIELAPHGIRVNGLAPGWVSDEPKRSRLALLTGCTIDPIAIGQAALFLVSNELSPVTTGVTLRVDAGMALYRGRVPLDPPHAEGID